MKSSKKPRPPRAARLNPVSPTAVSTPDDAAWNRLSQREKFIQTARDLGCDESGDKLDEVLRTIAKAKSR